jgi:hypothetical protein
MLAVAFVGELSRLEGSWTDSRSCSTTVTFRLHCGYQQTLLTMFINIDTSNTQTHKRPSLFGQPNRTAVRQYNRVPSAGGRRAKTHEARAATARVRRHFSRAPPLFLLYAVVYKSRPADQLTYTHSRTYTKQTNNHRRSPGSLTNQASGKVIHEARRENKPSPTSYILTPS